MLKKSFFLYHFFHSRQIFSARPTLTDLSTWGQIDNVAGRGLIIGWPSTQRGEDS